MSADRDRQAPWQWGEEQWRPIVERVRAGRSLKPATWPGGARCAFALSFDVDHETSQLINVVTQPALLSRGEYGARSAMPRILGLLERYQVAASFFVPGVAHLLYPGQVRECHERGHEIGLHGWLHEYNVMLDRQTEYDRTARSMDALAQACGEPPVGIRTPWWEYSDNTIAIIQELGLAYDSSLMADNEPYEILSVGRQPTGIVEVPVELFRDDAMYLSLDRATGVRPHPAPRDLVPMLLDELDYARAEGGLFQLTCHPHVIGHRSRIVILQELLEHVQGDPDVWVATHREVAEFVWAAASETTHDA